MPAIPKTNGHTNSVVAAIRLTRTPLANDPHLLDAVARDIAALGVVGEEAAGVLLYLVATSRLQPAPLQAILKGPSSTGKSWLQRTIAEMMPAEERIEATSLTANALYYMEPGSLEHKLLLGGERKHRGDEEAADATAALRN